MATLDYSAFPHIFDNVIEHADPHTQNRLRLLSSSSKQDVDRYHCRYLQICEVAGNPPHRLCIGALHEPATLNSYRPVKVPLLSSPEGPLREGPNVQWALRNTHHLTVWDRTLGSPALNNLLTHLSHLCADLTLNHSLIRLNNLGRRIDETKAPLIIPTHVRRLRVLVTTDKWPLVPYWTLKHFEQVVHTCVTLTIVLEKKSHLLEGLSLVQGLLHSCVQQLILIADQQVEVHSYLMTIPHSQFHPDLHITICLIPPFAPTSLQTLREMWLLIINAKITVKSWTAGRGGVASVDSDPPTKSPGTKTPREQFLHTALGSL